MRFMPDLALFGSIDNSISHLYLLTKSYIAFFDVVIGNHNGK